MLGEQLRKVRQARGLSVSEVARRAGIDRRHLGKIEGGEIPSPGVETVSRIARALGTSPEEFIVGGPVRPVQADPAPVQGESWMYIWRNLSTAQERADFLEAARVAEARHPHEAMKRAADLVAV